MRSGPSAFAGWPGGARRVAPHLFERRDRELARQFDFLLRLLTPRTVFMEVGSADCELSLRVAGYVERVWCVESAGALERAPCNLRRGNLGGVPLKSVHVAFSERAECAAEIRALLKDGGVWIVYASAVNAAPLRQAGFARVEYYGARLRLPYALARIARSPVTAAYR